MGLEKYFEAEESFTIDWKNFPEKIKDTYSREYQIFHSNILSNKLNATKTSG